MEKEVDSIEGSSSVKKGFFGRMFSKKDSQAIDSSKDVVKEHDEVLRLKQELDEYHSQAPTFDDFEEQVNAEERKIKIEPVFAKNNGEDESIAPSDTYIRKDPPKKKVAKKKIATVVNKAKKNDLYLNKNGMRALEDDLLDAKKELIGKKQELWLAKGVPVKTIKQLYLCIKEMNEKTFLLRQEGEEFSHWLKDHHFSEELAFNLRDVRNREEALEEIDKYFITSIPLPVREETKAHHASIVSHFDKLNEEHRKAMQALEKTVKRRNPQLLNTERIKRQFSISTDDIIDTLTQLVYALELIDEKTYEAIPLEEKAELRLWVEELANKEKFLQNEDLISIQEKVIEEIRKYGDLITTRVEKEKDHYVKEDERLRKLQEQLKGEEKQLQAEWKNLQDQQKKTQSENDKQQKAIFTKRTNLEKFKENILKTISDHEALSENMRKELEAQEEALQTQEEQVLKRKEDILKEEKQLETRKEVAEEIILKKEKELEKKQSDWEIEKEKERQAIEKERVDAQELISKKLELIEQEKNSQEKLLAEKKEDQERVFSNREKEIEGQVKALEEQRKHYLEEQKRKEEELQKKEDAIGEGIEHIDKINKNVTDQKTELTKIREDLDGNAFKKYLAEQLKSISTEHVPLQDAPVVQKVQAEQYDFYEAIGVCNDCIESNKFEEAKKMYNALKSEYEKGLLPAKEKEVLYDAIRELYANLHLAVLNNS